MSLSLRQCAFTHAAALLVQKAEALGYSVKVVEWNRTIETQRVYVATGKSKTMDSRHLDGLAVDLALFKAGALITDNEAFRSLGVYWESLGGRWGGRFGFEGQPPEVLAVKMGWDPDHFEFRLS